jgi:hypothetical protein
MQFLLDDKKMYWIVGIIFTIAIIIYILPNNNTNKIITVSPDVATGITGFEPRYFNDEIYSLPNAKMSPYYLAGGNDSSLDYYNQFTNIGFNQLRPTVELLPKTQQFPIYMINN